jgi:hypothetical protein
MADWGIAAQTAAAGAALPKRLFDTRGQRLSAKERARLSRFKLGSRVRLSKLGRTRCPTMPGHGTVVGFSRRSTALQVLMDGRKTPAMLHLSYLELATQPTRPVNHGAIIY